MVSASTHQLPTSQNQTIPPQRQIVIIDPQIDDYQMLASAVIPGVELLILQPNRDGIEQITEYLQKAPQSSGGWGDGATAPLSKGGWGDSSLHIISHGSPGRIHLGNSILELNNIEQYRPQLQQWGMAHLYIYGCKVAAGDAGAEFITKLHQITGATIYANPHPTGNAALGGTWELQLKSPPFEGGLGGFPLNPETLATYPGILLEPEYAWAKSMGGSSGEGGSSITIDSSGNIYTIGSFWGTADFDPGPGTYNLTSAGSADSFISKLNPDGTFAWAKQLGGSGMDDSWSTAIDGSGNIYTIGNFQGTADFDPGPGTFNLTSAVSYDIFISKLDANGNYVWAKKMGAGGSDRGSSITLDSSGNVYTTGGFSGTVDFDPGSGTFNLTSAGYSDTFISKLNPDGSFAWAKNMGGSGEHIGNSITLDSSGNIYTTGSFSGTADFDPGPGTYNLTSAGSADSFISKLNPDGSFAWAKQLGGNSLGIGIAIDSSGNIYTSGRFNGTADFDPDPGTFNLTSAGGWDIFINKLNSDGTFAWAKQLGGGSDDYGGKIALDSSGNVYTTGGFSGTADFDPGTGTFNLTSGGSNDIFISKLNSDGTFAWAKNMGGSSGDEGYNIALDTSGNVYTTGYFTGTTDFDPGTGTANFTSAGSGDIFISKLTPGVAPTVTSITSSQTDGSYNLGSLIPITIAFSEPVTVTGTPTLTLNTGRTIIYTSGSGTNTLTFNYTVGTSENSSDLDYTSTTALNLNGGTIKDGATNDADLTLPSPGTTNSLGANKNLIIDTTPPTVTIEQAGGQTDPATTSPINFTVSFSEPITGFDPTDINFTGTTTTGTLTPTITGSGTTYNVAVSGMTSSGNVIVSINANAATDAASNNNTASTSTDNTVTYNTIPTITNINKTGDEDTNITFTETDFTTVFSDIDNDSLNKIQITSLPTNGILQIGGVDVTLNQEILLANIPNLTFIPAADFNGNSSFTWNGSDGSNYATTTATVNLTINPINDAPSFTATNPTAVNEDSAAINIPNWATFNPGPANEATQTATYTISNISNPGLFAAIPTVNSSGTLSYTPTADTSGISTFDVAVQDNGGGNNIFPAQTFSITVNPVNDRPSFSHLGNQTLSTWTNSPQTVTGWANTFIFGPVEENTQTVADFLINITSGNTLFTTPPDIANNGTLTYTPTGTPGTATISVQLQDNGGTANSGIDTSTTQTFTITIPPPTINLEVLPNSGSEAGTSTITINATAAGPVFGNQTLNLALSGTADNSDFSTTIPTQIIIPDGATTGSVTVTIAQDSIAEGDETATFTISNPTAGIQLGTTTNASFTITDNDTAGITVTPISLTTSEAGGMANFTVVLNSQPTADVTINLTSDNPAEGTVIPSLTFTPANWNQTQTVPVTGVDDNVDDGDINYNIITESAISADPNYNGVDVPDVVVTNTDNDTAGITVSATTINVTEGGANSTYDIVLTSAPTAPVTINFTTDSEINPIAPIIFDSTNWNQPHTVIVTAVDDSNIDRLHLGNITHSAVSNDPGYNGMTIAPVVANIADNDTGGVSIIHPLGSTDVLEGFGTDVYKLVLTSPPVADVTIALNNDRQITTDVPTVTFTPSNWNLPQMVTVTAVDDSQLEGNHQGNITHNITSDDPSYNNLKIPQIIGNISDNDNRGSTFQLSPPSIIGLTAQDDIVTSSTADDIVYDAAGNDVIDGGEGNDNLYAQAGDDGLNGGNGNDVIFAGLGNDHATGLGGDDILYGGEGNDRLYGDDGDDFLLGHSGNDFLFGGTGIDNLTGGTGRDAFVLSNGTGGMTVAGADIITDFVKGEDIFYLSGNLNFSQLVISPGMGNLANDAMIQDAGSGEFLAVVKGVAVTDLTASHFV
ncbi:MAG TPA: DUF4347 domain-containing protein [Oscillatoriaceae cyanobacterium M33_DOE_052]|uniref:DUF4347 domain-containing protein n=1 Tax=Planktothricoides sp. SpSt-374 TaxID=2282167 RepID=A0A7C3VEY6_9CYAN|nr:DUF4347 domain-containing protein [Oscillatoriaceae cyanobacterium M33_DOE_052]